MVEMIVMYPAPGLSHLVPMVEFGKRLITHNPNRYISFLIPTLPIDYNNDTTHSYISSISSSFSSITFHSLPTPPLPRHPASYPKTEELFFELSRLNNPTVHSTLASLGQTYGIAAFVIDFFCASTLEIGKSLDLPTYFFLASGASTLALFLNFPFIDRLTTEEFRGASDAIYFNIEGLPPIPTDAQLESMLDRGPTYNEFVNVGHRLCRSKGVIVNSFQEFEPRALKALYEGTCLPKEVKVTTPPVYCVGPLVSTSDYGGSMEASNKYLTWLDSQPSQTVVFVSFGSVALFQKDQLCELSQGLERSMQRFLWVVRDPPPLDDPSKRFTKPPEPDLDKILPPGFMDRTKGRGIVMKSWAPQKAILGHDSVGAFVTHCGWNSTLEAVCAGVPLVAWPLFAEQRFNRVVLVEEVKVAIHMKEMEEEGRKVVKAEEVERRIREIMESEIGDCMRKKMLVMKKEANFAISEEGSSSLDVAMFIESWKN